MKFKFDSFSTLTGLSNFSASFTLLSLSPLPPSRPFPSPAACCTYYGNEWGKRE